MQSEPGVFDIRAPLIPPEDEVLALPALANLVGAAYRLRKAKSPGMEPLP